MSISLCLLYSFFDNSLLKNVIFPYLSSDLTSVLLVSKEAAELLNKQCQIPEHGFRRKCKYNHEQETYVGYRLYGKQPAEEKATEQQSDYVDKKYTILHLVERMADLDYS